MPIPQNKEELLFAIHDTFNKLKLELTDLPEEVTIIRNMEGHAANTKMSVSDLVAYLIGWGELVLKWNRLIEQHEVVHFPEEGFKWTELGRLAQKFYGDYASMNYKDRLIKLEATVHKIVQLIEQTDGQGLYQNSWYKHYPMGRMIQLNTSSPYKNARSRIRKWKKSNSFAKDG